MEQMTYNALLTERLKLEHRIIEVRIHDTMEALVKAHRAGNTNYRVLAAEASLERELALSNRRDVFINQALDELEFLLDIEH